MFVCECSVADKTSTPDDYEVSSVARECEDADRGHECHVDEDELSATCYSSCVTHYCNDETPRPTWRDFRRRHASGTSESDADDETRDITNSDTEGSRLQDTGMNCMLANKLDVNAAQV